MPTYEYVCTSCHAPIEVVQSMHEPALTDCPSCSDGRLRKVFGNVGVVFKGSGFYRTDSRGKSGGNRPDSQPKGSQPASATQSSDGKSASSATKSASSDSKSSAGAGRSSGSAKSASSASRGSGSTAGTAAGG